VTRLQNILYVAEPSGEQASAIERAVALAENNQAKLTVMDVVPPVSAGIGMPPGGPIGAELQAAVEAGRRDAMQSLLAPHRARLDVRLDIVAGKRFLEVIRAVLRNGHDLVIKQAEDPEWTQRLFGSDDMHLLRKCPCPVWLMKQPEKSNYDSIVAAVDFDPSQPESIAEGLNRRILELAGSLSLSDFATLHVIHAWDAPAERLLRLWSDNPAEAARVYVEEERARRQAGLDKLREELSRQLGRDTYDYLAPRFHLIRGPAITAIPNFAMHVGADMVVMGTVARAGLAGVFIGNTAETILERLRCPVLAVKPPGFVSPVKLD